MLLLSQNDFTLQCIHFLEKKINMIMDGFFTKICFSDSCITMNGIYIDIPLQISFSITKNILHFDYTTNKDIIHKLSNIEKQLIQYYIFFYGISNKTPTYSLKTNLQSGSIKYYKDSNESSGYYIKISGIWETRTEIGITYKIIEY